MSIEIELFRPMFDEKEAKSLAKTIKSKWWGLGPKTKEFETMFADYIGVKYAVGVNSCTSALQLAVRSLDLPKDFTYIVPSISFISTAFAPIYEGYKVVFADVDPANLMINNETIWKAIEDWGLDATRTAIIPVHLYGNMMPDILNCSTYPVIEDCAHAAGSCITGFEDDKMAGSLGTMGCFSFHAVKNIACGDGGMITTNDEELYKKLISSRWFGINKSTFDRAKDENLKMSYGWEYEIEQLGYKMHMNDLIATLGIEQLKKLESSNARRRNIAAIYNAELADQEWLATPVISDHVVSAQHIYHIRTEYRNELNVFLKEKGVATGVHYKPMYEFKYFSGNIQNKCRECCPVTEREWLKLLSLPCYPSLTELEQAYIIAQIKDFGRKYNAVV